MRFIALNDLHISDRAPESRTDNYTDEVMDLLWQVHAVCLKGVGDPMTKVTAVLIAGDIFHRKSGLAMGVFRRVAEWCLALQAIEVAIVTVPGNHDLMHDRYESLPGQPLGVLYALGLMQDVSTSRGRGCAQWAAGKLLVKVIGLPFPDATQMDAWRGLAAPRPANETVIVLAHCFASLDGGELFGAQFLSYRTLAQTVDAHVFVFGHEHRNGGIVKVGDKVFINAGAISRGTIAEDDITRPISAAQFWVEPTGVHAEMLPLTFQPAADLFDVARKASRDAEHAAVAAFVATLRSDIAALDRGETVATHLSALDLPAQVRDVVLRYLDDVEQGL